MKVVLLPVLVRSHGRCLCWGVRTLNVTMLRLRLTVDPKTSIIAAKRSRYESARPAISLAQTHDLRFQCKELPLVISCRPCLLSDMFLS